MRLSDLDWRLKIPLALTAVIVLTDGANNAGIHKIL